MFNFYFSFLTRQHAYQIQHRNHPLRNFQLNLKVVLLSNSFRYVCDGLERPTTRTDKYAQAGLAQAKFQATSRKMRRPRCGEKWCRDQDLDWKEDCWSGIEIGQTLNNCTGLSPIVGCTKLYDII
ncbi:hypothetical protein evm_012560 [Chilo suppressalis]|nr:hypothetical protein evm_012560 [Chilo suppressalis]